MDEKSVPYIVFEGEMARNERHIKRLWILVIILAVMLVGTNIGWIVYESQFEEVVTTEEVTQDIDSGDAGGDIIVNGIGDIYGASKAND